MSQFKHTPLPKVVGFGTMGLTWTPNPVSQEQANEIYLAAYNSGARFFNAGEFYGPEGINLKYLNHFLYSHPELKDDIIVCVKGAIDLERLAPAGDKAGIQKSLDNILSLLPEKKGQLIFECARVDPTVPIEDTVSYIAEYVKAGKIGGISLSEPGVETIKKASKIAPIAFVEIEFSLWFTEILTNGIADVCRDLNIPIVAYSPLGSGFLTGTITSTEDLAKGDLRTAFDKFSSDEVIKQNTILLQKLQAVANDENLSLAQLSLAWIAFHNNDKFVDKAKYPLFVPIPGSTKPARIADNSNIREIGVESFNKINKILKETEVVGGQYNEQLRAYLGK